MFVRVLTFTGTEHIDDGVRFMQEEAVPVLRQQHGYRGLSVNVDPAGGVLGVLGRWETEADREASDGALGKTREEALRVLGGGLVVERYEEAVWDVVEPPVPGSSVLMLRRLSMPVARIDGAVEFFRQVAVPELRAQAGFQAARQLIDRQTGRGQVGTVWADAAARETGDAAGEARRRRATADRGVTFGEVSRRDIRFIDSP